MNRLLDHYPFQTALSFEPLITFLRKLYAGTSEHWDKLFKRIDQAEELRGEIDNPKTILPPEQF